MKTSNPRISRSAQQGFACVEFAIALPILIYVVLGIVDLGRFANAYITITNAARNGAYYGSMSTPAAADTSGIRNAALADTTSLAAAPNGPTVTSTTTTDAQGYTVLTVTVSYKFSLIAGIPGLYRSMNLTRAVQMRVAGSQ